ncbi:MAG: tRNA pseudouridine(55) synthase TruB [Gemmatimonadota bacterium]
MDEEERRRVGHGQRLSAPDGLAPGLVALAHDHELVAVAEVDQGTLRPRKVFT